MSREKLRVCIRLANGVGTDDGSRPPSPWVAPEYDAGGAAILGQDGKPILYYWSEAPASQPAQDDPFGCPERFGRHVIATSVGLLCDGRTDDTIALNNALARFGGVFLPEGVTLAAGIKIPRMGSLLGAGVTATSIKRPSTHIGASVIEVQATENCCEFGAFSIDGNRSKNSRLCDGVVVNAKSASLDADPFPNANVRAEKIHVHHITGNGFTINSGNVSFYKSLTAYKCDNYGMYFNTQDSSLFEIDLGSTGKTGFVLGSQGYNNKIISLKTWYNGEFIQSDTEDGDGIFIKGCYNQFSGIEVQNAARFGINMGGCRHTTMSSVNVEIVGKVNIKGQGLVFGSNTRDCAVFGNIHTREGEGRYMEYAVLAYDPTAIRNLFAGSTEAGTAGHVYTNPANRGSTTIISTAPGVTFIPPT